MSNWIHLSDTTPVAHKDYWCIICSELIPKGEKHTARRGISDNIPLTFRMHFECDEKSSTWTQDDWECHMPGDCKRPKKKCTACNEVGAVHCAHPEDCGNI